MAKRIQLPDGSIGEFPDSMADDEIEKVLSNQFKPTASAGARQKPAEGDDFSGVTSTVSTTARIPSPTAKPVPPEEGSRFGGLVGRSVAQGLAGIADAAGGGAKLVTRAITSGFNPVDVLSSLPGMEKNPVVSSLAGLQSPIGRVLNQVPTQAGVRELTSQALTRAGVAAPRTAAERVASDIGEGVTGGLATGGTAGLARLPLTVGSAALGSGASSVARELGAPAPVQLGAGLLAGLAPGGITAALRSPGKLAPIVERVAESGGTIRAASAAPGGIASFLRGIPGTGAKGRYAGDVEAFNRDLFKNLGVPAGTSVENVYSAGMNKARSEFDNFAQNRSLVVDAPLVQKLAELRNTSGEIGGIPKAAASQIDSFIDSALKQGGNKSGQIVVSGDKFKALDTLLGKTKGASDARNALRDQFKSTLPPGEAKQWDDLMRRYGDLRSLKPLFAEAQTGKPIDPRDILKATSGVRFAQQERTVMGARGPLGELAVRGQYIVPPKGVSNLGASLGAAGGAGLGVAAGAPAAIGTYGIMNLLGRLADRPLMTAAQRSATLRSAGIGAATGAATGARTEKGK